MCVWDLPEIDEDTPLEEIKRIHQMIWQYVVEHDRKPDTYYQNNCACCEYTIGGCSLHCENCPIVWIWEQRKSKLRGPLMWCMQIGSLYQLWINEFYPEKRRLLAERIRDIPFKFEEENYEHN